MLDLAGRLGFTHVTATVLADNAGMLHLLHTTGLDWSSSIESGVTTLRALLPDRQADAPLLPLPTTPA
jgi:hypothetical protein